MSLFMGPMRKHLEGFKDLTANKEIVEVKAGKEVFIPLYASHSANFDVLVKEGDHVSIGTKLAQCNDRMIVPIFSSVSGSVKGISKVMHATLKPCDHVVIENDGKDERIQAFKPLDYKTASKAELVEFMKNAGIVGLGGAGFPTYVKYCGDQTMETLLINAVECEPYITADYKMVKEYLDDLLLGIKAMIKMSGAKECKVAIKKTKKEFIDQVKEGLKDEANVNVVEVPDAYPMGWEKSLVRYITKKDYKRLPSEIGYVVNNASTAIAFADALVEGMPIISKVITVSGDAIKDPCNVKARIGTPVHEIIEAIGGYTADDVKLIAGGPMMGKTIVNDKFVIDRPANALTIIKNVKHDSIACLRCGACSDHCPAGLQPVRIAQALNANDQAMMARLSVDDCMECGLCTYVCPSYLDVTENVRKVKRQMALKKK